MKTTVEIDDDLFRRVQTLAREQGTTFQALTETGLRLVVAGKHREQTKGIPPLMTFGGGGPAAPSQAWDWDRIRDEIYAGRGA